MTDWYLRAEAVNLGNTVYDTNDISTIRGGGFMLLQAVNEIAKSYKSAYLKKVSIGASAGLFKLEGQNGKDLNENEAEVLRKAVESELLNITGNHATFVVDVLYGKNKSFLEVHETLMAMNRRRQFQQLTLPWGNTGKKTNGKWEYGNWEGDEKACVLGGVWPGTKKEKFREKEDMVSPSVKFRRDKGRYDRQKIYEKILEDKVSEKFTDDLEELSDKVPDGYPKNLKGKIAFIYVDGNRFGRTPGKLDSHETLSGFDKAVQDDFRKPLLAKIIDYMSKDPASKIKIEEEKDGKKGKTEKIRLETLLWGGDEFEWVVPAWKGWQILQMFYEHDQCEPPPDPKDDPRPFYSYKKNGEEKKHPLTHAAGIVFCHHNSHILHIRRMAHALAEMAKDSLPEFEKMNHENSDIFRYLVLESQDMVQGELKAYLPRYYQPADQKSLVVKGAEMARITKAMKIIRAHFPRDKVFRIVEAMRHGRVAEVEKIKDKGLKLCDQGARKEVEKAIADIIVEKNPVTNPAANTGGNDRVNNDRWFLIADLWDYAF